ncbi:hypothetical protein NGF19_27450 [Streptomyces sp. RY43-2]|uniref:Uncharacterized protein n=1 Tax=Streptomyces macrolidinus TaxID=2952607 RepID=A0ABT0ZLK4_9ACTN|nr:hypothetical protein [Streptomyces macrolidinus]MCN9244474.1 hypothetical protein [Streptomyces macrolidinus]
MEQRIGSSSKPLNGAGVDPAFIPGLTSPASAAEPEDATPEETTPADTEVVEAEVTPAAVADADEKRDRAPSAKPESEAVKDSEEEPGEKAEEKAEEEPAKDSEDSEESEESAEKPAPDGPVFEASDRRAKIVADHCGVRLRLDDQECEFRWDEIGAVETETARFGKRFTVTVHTPERRWYPIEIEADSRARFQEWDNRLDEVLDAYFDDEDDEEEPVAVTKDDD